MVDVLFLVLKQQQDGNILLAAPLFGWDQLLRGVQTGCLATALSQEKVWHITHRKMANCHFYSALGL